MVLIMKKLFIIFSLLIASTLIQAQLIVKADLFKQHSRQDITKEFPRWEDPQKDSTIIGISEDSLIIVGKKDVYKLDSLLTIAAGTDRNDGDKWIGVKWLGTDLLGIRVMIVIQSFESHTIMITITYGDVEYRYQCRPIENENKLRFI
jgi:hypothetical protein